MVIILGRQCTTVIDLSRVEGLSLRHDVALVSRLIEYHTLVVVTNLLIVKLG